MDLCITSPLIRSLVVRKEAVEKENYDLFIEQLYKDLLRVIRKLQGFASNYFDKSEDDITIFIASNLDSMGYDAKHDPHHNGHVDLYVEQNEFKWLGECKLQKGNEYSNEGFKQLTTRYSDGHEFGNRGGILIYNQKKIKGTLDCMLEWHSFLRKDDEVQNLNMECDEIDEESGRQYFDSKHKHEKSKMPYKIRHFFINLMHDPKDHLDKPKSIDKNNKPRKIGRPKKNST